MDIFPLPSRIRMGSPPKIQIWSKARNYGIRTPNQEPRSFRNTVKSKGNVLSTEKGNVSHYPLGFAWVHHKKYRFEARQETMEFGPRTRSPEASEARSEVRKMHSVQRNGFFSHPLLGTYGFTTQKTVLKHGKKPWNFDVFLVVNSCES